MNVNDTVHEDDKIYFRIPLTVYWIGKQGGYPGIALCFYRKVWDVETAKYYFQKI